MVAVDDDTEQVCSPTAVLKFGFESEEPETGEKAVQRAAVEESVWGSVDLCNGLGKVSKAKLTLADGTVFHGFSFGAECSVAGEVVFNTGMVGYPESLTDPSYRGQILTLTYPLIGNYGVPDMDELDDLGLPKYFESDRIHVQALIVCSYSHEYSHWQAKESLSAWLKRHNVPALYGIDTRALTKKIREHGAILGKIEFGNNTIAFDDPNKRNLVAEVSRKMPQVFGSGPIRIIGVDCGMKNNIIRYLVKHCKNSDKVTLKVVPWDYDYTKETFDGLFLSNGPGNPAMVTETVTHLKTMLARETPIPIFGICMGNQLLSIAAGASTYKMKYGNRGMNQPCIDLRTTRCYITPQNHGFAVDSDSIPKDWEPFFVNANDNTNEGIIHSYKPFFSVQFHPEAKGGPHDTSFLFDQFLSLIRFGHPRITTVRVQPAREPIGKVLLLGSGGISIGQAGEFDYSGAQCIKALKEENMETVLVNPNIATIQTSAQMADKVYFLPVTPEFVTEVIKKERPDGILLQFGGQTALNCGIKLQDRGILDKYNVEVLGTSIETIRSTEDRKIFGEKLREINEFMAPSFSSENLKGAIEAANKIGYPVLVRAAFALGGQGSGFANNQNELESLVSKALSISTQVIIDKSVKGWKEVEYEVVRDAANNCIAVCNMENFDPVGVHTGESIVVAPSQTLSNEEYMMLRETSLKVIRHLGVVGECNIQFALNPHTFEYCIIEVNARLSRSSALASKATGYPLAYVACKLALGLTLPQIRNQITKKTCACFEPSMDYLVIKIPRWDLKKFNHVSKRIGSAMKSIGEVMSIGKTFEEAIQKAVRMVNENLDGFGHTPAEVEAMTSEELDDELAHPTDMRLFAIGLALQRGYSVERIHALTAIDNWYLYKLRAIHNMQTNLRMSKDLWSLPAEAIMAAKQYGLSDAQIARCMSSSEIEVRKFRIQYGIKPFVKQIDTLAAEFPAFTNYLYMTYHASEHDLVFDEHGIMVLGCGSYRIGSSCEFDWCAVSCLRTLKSLGYKSVMVNYNPETVSTDFDESNRLYFEELSMERILDIYEVEQSAGVVVSVGGQVSNTLAMPLHRQGVRILGTHPNSIDNAEDRHKFSELLDSIGVDQPEWKQLTTVDEALKFAERTGYPVLVRPSYVLSGAAMNVAYTPDDLCKFLSTAVKEVSADAPVVISKFIAGAKEIEFDCVAKEGVILNYAISEHVENAGVHSGDATLVLPAQKLYVETIRLVKLAAKKIAKSLNITGPFNMQFLSKDNDIKVIECNLRASRSFPFVSKTFNVNFIELATKAMLGCPVKASVIDLSDFGYVNVKAPMFSFGRLQGSDPVLSVEMASTGEVACFGESRQEAFLKALIASGFKIPKRNILVSVGPLASKIELLPSIVTLHRMGFRIFATEGSHQFLIDNDVPCTVLYKPSSKRPPSILKHIADGKIDMVINVPESHNPEAGLTDGYYMRRAAVDFNVSLITDLKLAVLLTSALDKVRNFSIKSWDEYLDPAKVAH